MHGVYLYIHPCVLTDSMSILTVNHLYILVPSIWCLCHLPSHHSTVCCIPYQRKRRVCGEIGCLAFFSAVFSDIRHRKHFLIGQIVLTIWSVPAPIFFIIITRTIFFYFNLHRDIRATDPSWTFIWGKKITSQEIKYDHNSFNRVGLYLENFLSLPICSK